MSETLCDLVVSLSLQTDNFTQNIKSVSKQIAEAESQFKLAAAGVEGFGEKCDSVTNPGSVSYEPVITVYGSGEITLMMGITITELEVSGSITLDTPLMEAYSGYTSMNSAMSGDFPVLLPGQNAVSWTGNVTKVEIQPNWRFL